ALDELVRIAFDDHTILARSGLALVGIATELNRLAGVFRDEAPLQTGRKSRAAPPAYSSCFRGPDNVFGRNFFYDFFPIFIAAQLDVPVILFHARFGDILQQTTFVRLTK